MPRPEKVQAVEDIKTRIEASEAAFLTEYRGLTVPQQQDLRRRLMEAHSDYTVVKMSLARRAVEALGLQALEEWLSGPTAIAYAKEDPVLTAKALSDFSKDHPRLVLKAALLGGQIIDPSQVATLAQIESREVLLAKVVGAGKAPLSQLAGLLSASARNAASMLRQLVDQRRTEEVSAPPDDSEGSSPEAAAAEEPAEDSADDDTEPAEDSDTEDTEETETEEEE